MVPNAVVTRVINFINLYSRKGISGVTFTPIKATSNALIP